MTRIAVVGAGIVGATIAHYATRRGADVTLIDPGPPATSATGASFGWIGESVLPGGVLREWRRLEETVPGVGVSWTGSLTWPAPPHPPGATTLVDGTLVDGTPIDAALVDAARIAALQPRLRTVPASAVHRREDGALDPRAVIAAVTAGITRTTATATAVHAHGVETTAGLVPADTTIVAAGAATPALCGVLLPIGTAPAALVRYDAPPGLINTVLSGPDLEIRQAPDGELLAPSDCSAHPGRAELDAIARRTTGAITATLDGTDTIRLRGVQVGHRPMPADGNPVIGPLDDHLYVAVMHSGVTLAPLAARLITQEILDRHEAPELAAVRPTRFGVS
ncbi:FAD-binding oxidoreductase [Actinoplanes sp. NPDC051633]|uniref:NAD(P)/FAD-dependent oxidoreductase n=1 Tax=Actinoplanes sp. NPDC051633 TaxID=3155670 RepID=UPI003425AFD5